VNNLAGWLVAAGLVTLVAVWGWWGLLGGVALVAMLAACVPRR
jgi:hypothetical protein